ncbi:hypothetical protein SRHO_G00324680 [Serrasalmus rhombeus]
MERSAPITTRCQHQGWMGVTDMKGSSVHWISCGQPLAEPIGWRIKFCLLTECELVLLDKAEISPLLVRERRAESCTVWLLRHSISLPRRQQLHKDQSTQTTPSSECSGETRA